MDNLSSRAAVVRAAGREAGILPGEPLAVWVETVADASDAISRVPDEAARSLAAVGREVAGEIKGAKAEFLAGLGQVMQEATTAAGGQVARNVAEGLPAAVDRLVLQRWWLMALAAAAAWCLTVGGLYLWMGHENAVQNEEVLAEYRSQVAHVGADLNAVIVNRDAANWLALIRMNGTNGAVNSPQDCKSYNGSGVACTYTFWTKLPAPK